MLAESPSLRYCLPLLAGISGVVAIFSSGLFHKQFCSIENCFGGNENRQGTFPPTRGRNVGFGFLIWGISHLQETVSPIP
jgi:hypothetical protein